MNKINCLSTRSWSDLNRIVLNIYYASLLLNDSCPVLLSFLELSISQYTLIGYLSNNLMERWEYNA